MTRMRFTFLLSCFLPHFLTAQTLELEYEDFTVWIDCERRGAIQFEYIAQADGGNFPRRRNFHLDDSVDLECQQSSVDSYLSIEPGYDRGHLVPANHLDHSQQAILDSNTMTNILPQASSMNRGAWQLTEEIIECLREDTVLHVIGGVIWGRNPHDDHYLTSHSVATPDYFWKVVIREDTQDAIAWLIPNTSLARRSELNRYLIKIEELEILSNLEFPVSDEVRTQTLTNSWPRQPGCDLS